MGMQTYLYLISMEVRYVKGNNRLFMAKRCLYIFINVMLGARSFIL